MRESPPAAVRIILPDSLHVPPEMRGAPYEVRAVLSDGDDNPKMAKSNMWGTSGYHTFGLSLAPHDVSTYQVCSSSSPSCRQHCLFWQGHGRGPAALLSRVARTVAFFTRRDWFMDRMVWDMVVARRRCTAVGLVPAFRLNITSDILWERVSPRLFDDFADCQFYDYTKHVRRMIDWCAGRLPANYHLTFSRSEENEVDCVRILRAGGNIAAVFRGVDRPQSWNGFRVVQGDDDDLRFLDPKNVVVALRARGTAVNESSGFVLPLV